MIPILVVVLPDLSQSSPVSENYSDGPYCGIYCVYSAARMHGREVAFDKLLAQEFVGSYRGSTVDQLQDAAARLGLTATAFEGLTIASLRSSEKPVILHVRRPGYGMPYSHWVLYAGTENGQARVLDPPGGVELIPFAELASYWDGIGIAISAEPLSSSEMRSSAWVESAGVFLGATLLLAAFRMVRLPNAWWKHVVAAIAIVAIGGLVGLSGHFLCDDGFHRNEAAVGMVKGQHFEPQIAEMDIAEMKGAIESPGVTIVDARVPEDYKYGHLPGAVSLPIASRPAERRAFANSLPSGGRVIVYCQSSGCRWADSVAADLCNRGFVNIAVYRGGWQDWESHE